MTKRPTMTALAFESVNARGARFELPDDGVAGLRLVVQPSGHKSWAVRYTFAGRDRKYTLGSFDKIELGKARKLAAAALLKVAAGTDPQAEKIDTRRRVQAGLDRQHLFGAAYESYLEKYAKPTLRPRSLVNVESTFDRVLLPKFRRRALGEILPGEIKSVVDKSGDPRRVFVIARAFFNWCKNEYHIASPMDGLKGPSASKPRERVLTDLEIKWLWRACDEIGYPFGPAVKLLLMTAARKSEVAEMRRSEIDWDKRLWTLPSARTKNGREHSIYLSDTSLEILDSLPAVRGKADYCFTTSGETSASGFSKAKTRIDKLMAGYAEGATIEPWVIHDLRRTAASGMARIGVSLPVIERALNHISGSFGGIVGVYQRHEFSAEKQDAFERWAAHLLKIVRADSPVSRHEASIT